VKPALDRWQHDAGRDRAQQTDTGAEPQRVGSAITGEKRRGVYASKKEEKHPFEYNPRKRASLAVEVPTKIEKAREKPKADTPEQRNSEQSAKGATLQDAGGRFTPTGSEAHKDILQLKASWRADKIPLREKREIDPT